MEQHEPQYQNKNILITGGLGFIGSNLAIKLVDLGANVLIVDSLHPECGGNIFNIQPIKDKTTVKISEIQNHNLLPEFVKNKDYIFNLVGQVSHIDSLKNPLVDLEINCQSHLALLEACKKHNRGAKIVYSCTRQIYGRPQYLPVNEKHPICPIDVNGINKIAGEFYHFLYEKLYGIATTSIRLTNTYGPRQLVKHNRQGFIGWFIRQAIEGREITIFGDGSQVRDFNYIDDVVDALLLAGTRGEANGEAFNPGAEKHYSLLDFTKILLKISGGGSFHFIPFPLELLNIDIGNYWGDYKKISTTLGWQPRVSLEEGLAKTVEYYRLNQKYYW